MNNLNFLILTLITSLYINNIYSYEDNSSKNINKTIYLKDIKNPTNHSLSINFLKLIKNYFNVNTFIETGTFLGYTLENAASVFSKNYSIELDHQLYLKSKQKFLNFKNVTIYLGDSGKVLCELMTQAKGTIMIWLDGHYSEGITAKGEDNTPILRELNCIAKSKLEDCVILIDDIRSFYKPITPTVSPSLEGYPTINDLLKKLRNINSNFNLAVLGDILLAYPRHYKVNVSNIIKACTLSSLSHANSIKISPQQLLNAEEIISKAQGAEREYIKTLHNLFSYDPYGQALIYSFWEFLILSLEGDVKQSNKIKSYLLKNKFNRVKFHI